MGDRNQTHGDPTANMSQFANLLNAAFDKKLNTIFSCGDAALIMALAKVARILGNANHRDSFVDAAAYLAIAAEVERTP
jgi:hypothetical protein